MVYSIALHLADVPQIITAASTTVYTKSSQVYRQLTGLRHGDLVQPYIIQKCAPLTLSLRHMLVDNVRFMYIQNLLQSTVLDAANLCSRPVPVMGSVRYDTGFPEPIGMTGSVAKKA